MSRRGKTIVKRVVLDPKFNSELVAHMIRVIMKDGKKTVAEKIVYGAIEKVAEKMKEDPSKFVKDEKQFEDPLEVVSAAIDNMKPQVEVKTQDPPRRRHDLPGSRADRREPPALARPPLDDAVRGRTPRHGHARRRRSRDHRRVPGPGQRHQEARRRAQDGAGQQGVRALLTASAFPGRGARSMAAPFLLRFFLKIRY